MLHIHHPFRVRSFGLGECCLKTLNALNIPANKKQKGLPLCTETWKKR